MLIVLTFGQHESAAFLYIRSKYNVCKVLGQKKYKKFLLLVAHIIKAYKMTLRYEQKEKN